MPGLLPNIDPDGLLEFSVVYTDRALNHMSKKFQGAMKDISGILKDVYQAHSTVLVPGSAVALSTNHSKFPSQTPLKWSATVMRSLRAVVAV